MEPNFVHSRSALPQDSAALPDWALVNIGTACAVTGSSRSHFMAQVKAGQAPAPAVSRHRFTRWRLGDLRQWAESLAAPQRKGG